MATLWRVGERLTGGLAVALLALAVMSYSGSVARADDGDPVIKCPGNATCNNNCQRKMDGSCMPTTTCSNGMPAACSVCLCTLSVGSCVCS